MSRWAQLLRVARASGALAARLRSLAPDFSANGFMTAFGARIEPVERFVAALERLAASSLPPPRQ